METVCSKCKGASVFKQGIKKETGKPWSGYFCQNASCKNVDWTPKHPVIPKTASASVPKPVDSSLLLADEVASLRSELRDLSTFLKERLG